MNLIHTCNFCNRGNLEKLYNDPTVNTNVYLCIYPPGAHAFGKGTLGGACSKRLSWHGVIMSYDFTDMIVARVSLQLQFE
jgi:hypothetical protein